MCEVLFDDVDIVGILVDVLLYYVLSGVILEGCVVEVIVCL